MRRQTLPCYRLTLPCRALPNRRCAPPYFAVTSSCVTIPSQNTLVIAMLILRFAHLYYTQTMFNLGSRCPNKALCCFTLPLLFPSKLYPTAPMRNFASHLLYRAQPDGAMPLLNHDMLYPCKNSRYGAMPLRNDAELFLCLNSLPCEGSLAGIPPL